MANEELVSPESRLWQGFTDDLYLKLEGFDSGFPVPHLPKSSGTTTGQLSRARIKLKKG